MAFINNLLKKVFGSKAERDMKEIKPILAKVLAAYERIDRFSNDELRAEAERLKRVIRERIAEDENCVQNNVDYYTGRTYKGCSSRMVRNLHQCQVTL